MRLYEYEGKILFKKSGIRIPKGQILEKETASSITENGGWPKVVKAQVLKEI
jgi:succinyl-CoA synthetase beta subunit